MEVKRDDWRASLWGEDIRFFEELEVKAATGANGTVRQVLQNYLGGELKVAAPAMKAWRTVAGR